MLFPSKNSAHRLALQVVAMSALLNAFALGQDSKPTISVTGEAEMSLVADEIVIRASIESRAKTPAEACKDNREKSRLLLEFLRSKNIDEKMINADLLSINPILSAPPSSSAKGSKGQQNNENTFGDDPFGDSAEDQNPFAIRGRTIGYTAFREFAIIVKDLKKFEDIYQGIVEKGINRIDSVRYRSSQEKTQLDKLRVQAVQVAKERAQAMANELGAELSAIESIGNSKSTSRGSDSGIGMGASRYGGRDDLFESTPSSTTDGQITLRNSVDVVFYLGNSEFKK